MLNMTFFTFLCFLILKGISADDKNATKRSGVQLWRAQGDLDEDVIADFYDRARYTEEIWKRDNNTIDFLLFDEEVAYVSEFLDDHNVTHTVLIDNFQGRVNQTLLDSFPARRFGHVAVFRDQFTWQAYPNLNEIYSYLTRMEKNYPTFCKLSTIGKTLHGKPIYMLKISTGRSGNIPLLIDGGTHGCEKTSVLANLYFIDSLIQNFTKYPDYIQKKDWHIIPVLNPDGYEYSFTKDHMWRKNRRRISGGCYGVDLNRNFDHNWAVVDSQKIPCSKDYAGPTAFSEEETKAFKRLVEGTHFKGYISIHSAGGKVLFSYSPLGLQDDDYKRHLSVSKEIALAMRKISGYYYVNGDTTKLGPRNLYGLSMDWMYHVKEIRNSYTIETRGHQGYDFLSPDEILKAVREIRAGLFRFAEVLQ